LVVVEDHWAEGGLGAAVTEAFASGTFGAGPAAQPTIVQLAVQEMPGSGAPAELLSAAGIDAEHIAQAVRELAAGKLKTAPASHGIRLDQTSGSPK
jgi:transketolase